MTEIKRLAFQGDVAFLRVDSVPKEATAKAATDGVYVLAHSETQHHHVMRATGVEFFEVPGDPLTCYLHMEEPGTVEHLRPFDTHEPITLPAGCWKVRRAREHTPEGWRMVMD